MAFYKLAQTRDEKRDKCWYAVFLFHEWVKISYLLLLVKSICR